MLTKDNKFLSLFIYALGTSEQRRCETATIEKSNNGAVHEMKVDQRLEICQSLSLSAKYEVGVR